MCLSIIYTIYNKKTLCCTYSNQKISNKMNTYSNSIIKTVLANNMSIQWDCYPKRLRSIVVRNLQGYPSNLTLSITNHSKSINLTKSHIFTSNPTWRQLDIPGSSFPLSIEILNESKDVVYKSELKSEEMYFICEQLEDLNPFNFPALLLEFNHEAYYTTAEYAESLTKLAVNCDKLLKYQATSEAKARMINHFEARQKYTELYLKRKELSDITLQIQTIKTELISLFPSKKYHYLNYKKTTELEKECGKYKEIIQNQTKILEKYKKLIQDKIGQKKVYDELLKAHKKKKGERVERVKKEKEIVIFKERLLKGRRIKMMRELWEALIKNEIFRFRDNSKRNSMIAENEEDTNFSYGYLAHATDILNDIFGMPSIYYVKFLGSRSSIIYQGRDLPLYYRQEIREIPGIELVKNDFEKHFPKVENEKLPII